ncbi:NAD(P)H-dependent oxidoreductase [Pedobacter sp. UYP1]|uniref:NAD(P)H-dependent oxidoreductase n=1 Tax=Pedobacter sp. UYP1 TaxID=1756396 RepID=UPI00339B527B
MKNNVLIISGHPDLSQSFGNSAILKEVEKLAPKFKINDLSGNYPDFKINVEAEQAKLVEADVIVWQFPIQWFSAPAIFKKWQDDVLVHGFAYGSTGKFLKDKKIILSVTLGGDAHEYAKDDRFRHTVEEFLVPLIETVPYCNMIYAGLIYSAGIMYIDGVSDHEALLQLESKAVSHAHELIDLIKSI